MSNNQIKSYSSEIEKSPRKETADIMNKSNNVAEMENTNFINDNFDDCASTDVSIQSQMTEDTKDYDSFDDCKLATSLNLEKMDEVNVRADSDEYNFDDCARVREEIQEEIIQDAESLDEKFLMQPDVLYEIEKFTNVHDFKTDSKFEDPPGTPTTDITVNDIQADVTDLIEEFNQDAKSLDGKFLVQTEGVCQTGGPIFQGNKLEVSCDTLSGDYIPVSEHRESQGENKFYANEASTDDDSLYEAFREDRENKKFELVISEKDFEEMVNPSDILGVMDHNDLSDEEFWNHHGNSKSTYLDLASKIPEVKELLARGSSLDDIKTDDNLRACAEQYFDLRNMVSVYRYGEKYIFNNDGRHRVSIAKELGYKIPAKILGIYLPKSK